MIILASLIGSIATVLNIILQTTILIVVIRAILSWVNPDPYNPIVRFINGVTDPLLNLMAPVRRWLSRYTGQFDLTPLILILVLIFLQTFLVSVLTDYSIKLRAAGL